MGLAESVSIWTAITFMMVSLGYLVLVKHRAETRK